MAKPASVIPRPFTDIGSIPASSTIGTVTIKCQMLTSMPTLFAAAQTVAAAPA